MTGPPCTVDDLDLIRLLDGELTENRARELNQHRATCPACVQRVATYAALQGRLRQPPVDLTGLERRLDVAAAAPRPRLSTVARWSAPAAIGAALAAALALVVQRAPRTPDDATFVARGNRVDWRDLVTVTLDVASNVGVPARVPGAPRPLVAGARLGPNDGIVVRARNGNRTLTVYLAVFGVDSRGTVHWFTPVWFDPTETPRSIALPPGESVGAPPEAVAPVAPAPGRLRVITLVTREAQDVRQVESLLAAGRPLTDDGRVDNFEMQIVVDRDLKSPGQ